MCDIIPNHPTMVTQATMDWQITALTKVKLVTFINYSDVNLWVEAPCIVAGQILTIYRNVLLQG
jgi:hypothetical protein